jgi:pimeloyl-ACP methyl ester carboxylesterase
LVGGFRDVVSVDTRFVEFTYPRTLEWSLEDYATAVDLALKHAGLPSGWLLAESFGSQIAWTLLGRPDRRFAAEALILAGGFVRHPLPRLVKLSAALLNRTSARSLKGALRGHAAYARWRRGTSPARGAELAEFLARRTELDFRAAVHRLRLIQGADPRPVAAATQLPVYYLTGLFDPVVPWPPVHRWLRRHCPGYRGWRLIGGSDHNVLSSAAPAARQVLAWMRTSARTGAAVTRAT